MPDCDHDLDTFTVGEYAQELRRAYRHSQLSGYLPFSMSRSGKPRVWLRGEVKTPPFIESSRMPSSYWTCSDCRRLRRLSWSSASPSAVVCASGARNEGSRRSSW